MSQSWDRSPTMQPDSPREFLVSVELYVSMAVAPTIRKPPGQRKKSDKRESLNPLSSPSEDGKKLKEKSSWLNLARSTGTGHWRPATCKLSEEGDRCLLNVYVDETILYQTVYIHLLNHTDIRQADTSLFFRKDCLGIYSATGQRWSSMHSTEPVYLQFLNADTCNTWLALLRSYAIPEVYGKWFFPEEGGSYRMWRQVELTILQGRNLGNAKPIAEAINNSGSAADAEFRPEPDVVDLDVSCEIHLNDMLCGRTTIKKGIGSPDWHESFTFSDLPPFENLDIIVWREKKLFKPSIMGSVRITLSNFRRGESVEGWFPVLYHGPIAAGLQAGEIRLRIRVDEEIILPYSTYSDLLQTFNSRNFLDWMIDFEGKLHLKTISTQLMSIAVAKNVLLEQVFDLADREVDRTTYSNNTLFRGNTTFTKIMEQCMAWYGKGFLEASIGSVLRRLCAEKVSIEVDPARSGKSIKDIEKGVDQLIYWCREFWKQIYAVRTECPLEMCKLFGHVRKLVETHYRVKDGSQDHNRELPWQSVSAFCFLRFIVPAILHPHLFGLCPGLPSTPVKRSLTLIAKVIQSLANLNANVQKEEFMRGVKDFLTESLPAMIDYILVVSTPTSDPYNTHPGHATSHHDRIHIVNSLRQRGAALPVLDREAIPLLPHLLDIPRHLAVITSAVIRNTRDYHRPSGPREQGDGRLDEFCAKCFEVEERALQRVSQLAACTSDRRRVATVTTAQSPEQSLLPSFPASHARHSSVSPSSQRRALRKFARPSTAPSSPNTDPSRLEELQSDISPAPGKRRQSSHFQVSDSQSRPSQSPTDDCHDQNSWPRGKHQLLRPRSASADRDLSHEVQSSSTSAHAPSKPMDAETSDDASKKKGLLRGILNRR